MRSCIKMLNLIVWTLEFGILMYILLDITNCIYVNHRSFHNNPNYEIQSNCICVPYWQCKEDFSGLVEDGVDIMDIRVVNGTPNNLSSLPCLGDFDVCCRIECGRLNNGLYSDLQNLQYRIMDTGSQAQFAEFPWMLGILHNKVFKCGASLIHPQVALTAAHCVTPDGFYKIRAGEWNWASQTEPVTHQDRFTAKILIHPHYHSSSLRNDIAIIILDAPFQMTENVGIMCLPSQPTTKSNTLKCVVCGWGKNSFRNGIYQSILKKIELPIVPTDKCLRSLRQSRLGPFFKLHNSFICAGGEQNRDTCKGDGGSPLMCPINGDSERYEQVGIVSWGLTCGVQNTPGVYNNVALFIDWIDMQMATHKFEFFYKA